MYLYIHYMYAFIYVNKSYVIPQKCHAIEKGEFFEERELRKKKFLWDWLKKVQGLTR